MTSKENIKIKIFESNSINEHLKLLTKTGYLARIFYDGWECPLGFYSPKAVEFFREDAFEMVRSLLMSGYCIKKIIAICKAKMEEMTSRLIKAKGNTNVLSKSECAWWWLGVFALLKLKALENDDSNGLVVMQIPKDN